MKGHSGTTGIRASTPESANHPMLLMPDPAKWTQTINSMFISFLSWVAAPLEVVFLRWKVGLRYFGLSRLFMGGVIMWLYVGLRNLVLVFGNVFGSNYPPRLEINPVFTALYILLGLYHIVQAWRRYLRHEKWHSESMGISHSARVADYLSTQFHFPSLKDSWLLYLLAEPIIGVAISRLVWVFDPVTGDYLIIATIALGLKSVLVWQNQMNRILDLIDTELESAYFNDAAFNRKPPQDTAGLVVASGFPERFRQTVAHDSSKADKDKTPKAGETSATAALPSSHTKRDFSSTLRETLGQKPIPPDKNGTKQGEPSDSGDE